MRRKGERSDLLAPRQVAALAHLDTVCVMCGQKATERHKGRLCCGDAVCRRQLNQIHHSYLVAEQLKRARRRVA